ncbi:type VI secretion system protein TssL, long form (plasmid) [Mesorhizobium sp. WSM2239]|uniref:Type VI secretion system protein TssL, long form n=2 Tax=unclassified Mesorhizobium TaxID=325217 RepID=A0AAU8DHJ7_9HYPH
MTSKDDPFASKDSTVIRPAGPKQEREPANRSVPFVAPSEHSAAISQPTIIASRSPEIGEGTSEATVISTGPAYSRGAGTQDNAEPTVIVQPGAGPPMPNSQSQKTNLEAILDARAGAQYPSRNPLIAAAAPLLLLLGRLRLVSVEAQASPLIDHAAEAVSEFERRLAHAGSPSDESRIATYVLCETVDDIAQSLPGCDRKAWTESGMLARFFEARTSGVGFFEALNKILANPAPHYNLLELMQVCLSLGFKGQYRGIPAGESGLARVRTDVYETLRYLKPRADDEIAPRAISASPKGSSNRLPLWAILTGVIVLLAGIYLILRIMIENEADAAAETMLALNPSTPIAIQRTAAPSPAAVPDELPSLTQIKRVRAALGAHLASKGVAVHVKNDFIVVEINNQLLFEPGMADLKPEFRPVAERITAALRQEPGPVTIVGHTDNVKPRSSSRFKSNLDLSVARATAVQKMIAATIGDSSRLSVEGRGDGEPIADNSTPEGRAQNRRVELMLPVEKTP